MPALSFVIGEPVWSFGFQATLNPYNVEVLGLGAWGLLSRQKTCYAEKP